MTYLFIFLGIALFAAGAALFVLDSRRRKRDDAPVPDVAPATPAGAVVDAGEGAGVGPGSTEDPADPAASVVADDAPATPEEAPGGRPAGGRHPLAGVAARRARKAWAAGRNAEFRKADAEMATWWDRVPAGAARDVVSGFAHGREMHLCDVGGVTLLALRRATPSDEILEFSRDGRTDLPEVGVEGGMTVSGTDPAIIHRIFDERAHRVLRALPESVTAAWAEGEWVIGAFAVGSGPDDWDAALAPMAGFADIARRLPPSPGSIGELDTAHRDPTRPSAEATAVTAASGHVRAMGEPADAAAPVDPVEPVAAGPEEAPTWRPPAAPATAVETPSRSVGKRMGDGDFRDLGDPGAGLPALGEDPEHSRSRVTGGRIIRQDPGPAGIFGDDNEPDDDNENTK